MTHTAIARNDIQCQSAYRQLKHNKQQCYKQCYGYSTHKHPHRLGKISSTVCLCCKTAGSHSQKTKIPINEIKYTGAYGNGCYMIERQMPHYGHIHHAQKRNSDIGNYIRYSKLKYLFIHCTAKYIFCKDTNISAIENSFFKLKRRIFFSSRGCRNFIARKISQRREDFLTTWRGNFHNVAREKAKDKHRIKTFCANHCYIIT